MTRPRASLARRQLLRLVGGAGLTTLLLPGGAARASQQAPGRPLDGTGALPLSRPGLPTIPLHYSFGGADAATAQIIIAIHGNSRSASGTLRYWERLTHGEEVLILVPEFTKEDFPTSATFHTGGILDEDGVLQPESRWTLGYVGAAFDLARSMVGGRQTHFDLFGHSAGSQFVHRYAQFLPHTPVRRMVAANAGWYQMPDPTEKFPYGSRTLPGSLIDWPAALAADLTILLGELDTDLDDPDLRQTAAAKRQGPHRLARGRSFMAQAQVLADDLGVPLAWSSVEVPDVAHDQRSMCAVARDIFR